MASSVIDPAVTLFRRRFGRTPPHCVRAPASVELLGPQFGCEDGIVVAAAVDLSVSIAVEPRPDGRVELVSTGASEPHAFAVNLPQSNPAALWVGTMRAVLDQLRKRGVHFSGFSAAVDTLVVENAGLASAPALAVATALAVRKLYPFTLTQASVGIPPSRDSKGSLPPLGATERLPVAKLCGDALHSRGVKRAMADVISSLFGKAFHVVEVDCHSFAVERIPIPGETLVICRSSSTRPNSDVDFDELARACESAAAKLGVRTLRALDLKQVESGRSRLTSHEYCCAHHVVSEIAWAVAGSRALREDDHQQFGAYMYQSYRSSRDLVKNLGPEWDETVERARQQPGWLGSRSEARANGVLIHLVAHHRADSFRRVLAHERPEMPGVGMPATVCPMADGAG